MDIVVTREFKKNYKHLVGKYASLRDDLIQKKHLKHWNNFNHKTIQQWKSMFAMFAGMSMTPQKVTRRTA